jgi:hypothetical protein
MAGLLAQPRYAQVVYKVMRACITERFTQLHNQRTAARGSG